MQWKLNPRYHPRCYASERAGLKVSLSVAARRRAAAILRSVRCGARTLAAGVDWTDPWRTISHAFMERFSTATSENEEQRLQWAYDILKDYYASH